MTLEPRHKRQTAITIRKVLRKRRDQRLLSLPSEGKAVKLTSKPKASAHFIRSGTFTRFVDWRFIRRARLGLLPVSGTPWVKNKGCQICDWEFESLCRILNHCNRVMTNMTKRHNVIARRIKTAIGNPRTGCELLFENQTIPGTPPAHRTERRDLVIRKGTKVFVIDVTIPFENGEDAFEETRKRKKEKYKYLKAVLKRGRTRSVTVDAFIIGSLGAWDPDNQKILKLFTSKIDRRLCVSNCIKWSREIPRTSGRRGDYRSCALITAPTITLTIILMGGSAPKPPE